MDIDIDIDTDINIEIDIDMDIDVEIDVDIDSRFGCIKGLSKADQVLLYGIEAIMVLTLTFLKQ